MILTTSEAAEELGVTDARVRQLVAQGRLTPMNPTPCPVTGYRFSLIEVADAQVARRPASEVARLDALAAVLASVA